MFWIIWLVTIVISIFITREVLKIDEDFFDEEWAYVAWYVLLGILFPLINVVVSLVSWGTVKVKGKIGGKYIYISDVLKVVFRIKDEK